MPVRTHAPGCAKARLLQARHGHRAARDQSGSTTSDCDCTCHAEYEAGALSATEAAALRAEVERLRSSVDREMTFAQVRTTANEREGNTGAAYAYGSMAKRLDALTREDGAG